MPELVKPEVGFLTDSESEMILHLKEGVDYSPMICHEYARDLFNAEIMAKVYLQKYEKNVLILVGRKEKSVFPILQIVYLINRFSL